MEFHEKNEVLRNKFKQEAWNKFTEDGPKDLRDWTQDHLDVFLDLFVKTQSETDDDEVKKLVDDVFPEGSVDQTKACIKCGDTEWIEDNRAKKAENPEKFGAIPDFACSQYMQNNGCGWGGYIGGKGDKEVPTTWL